MIPSVGRIVHYRLNDQDVAEIARRQQPGEQRNPHSIGQVIPFLICRVWVAGSEDSAVNGQGFVDGNFSIWLTSRKQGTEIGTWSDPRA